MKDILIRLGVGLFTFFLAYLIGAFISVSFNISEWHEEVRTGVGILGAFIGIGIATLPYNS